MTPYQSKFTEASEPEVLQPEVMEQVKAFVSSDEQLKTFVATPDEALNIRTELDYPYILSGNAVQAFGKVITGRKTHCIVELPQGSDLGKFYKLMEVADEKEIEKVVVLVV